MLTLAWKVTESPRADRSDRRTSWRAWKFFAGKPHPSTAAASIPTLVYRLDVSAKGPLQNDDCGGKPNENDAKLILGRMPEQNNRSSNGLAHKLHFSVSLGLQIPKRGSVK